MRVRLVTPVIAAAGLMLGVLTFAGATPAHALQFTVNTTADSGAGSLDQAITDANANPGLDTIVFDAAINGQTIVDTGLPLVTDNLTITGNGVGVTLIQNGSDLTANAVTGSADVTLTISGVTLSGAGGLDANSNLAGDKATLNATNVTIAGGGEVSINTASGTTVATLTNFTSSGGGGLFVNSSNGTTTVTATNLTMVGGDIFVNTNGGTASLTVTTANLSGGTNIDLNSNNGSTTGSFTATTLSGAAGDAIDVNTATGTATLNFTEGAVLNGSSEALELSAGGGTTTANIVRSLFSGNEGSLDVSRSVLNLTNSTVSNVLDDDAIDAQADGIVNLTNVTILGYYDGGVNAQEDSSVTMRNTAIAPGESGASACRGSEGITSLGGNKIHDTSCDVLNGPNDQEGIVLLLGPLADNGGPTFTHLPQAGSPLIDGGVNTDCPAVDQRNVARPQDGNFDLTVVCDSGAVEIPNPKTDLSLTKSADVLDTTLTGTVVWTLLVKNETATTATNVVVNDTLPSELELTSVTPPAGWSCVGSAPGAPPVVNCTKPTMTGGETAAILVATRVVTLIDDSIVNSAYVGAAETELSTANNTGTARVLVGELPETGSDTRPMVLMGVGLLGLGLVARLLGRRRSPARA